jgi:hypothetical protein
MNIINNYEVEFKKIKPRVEFILKHNEASRNDDTTLCFLYWLKFEALGTGLTLENIKKVFNNHSDLLSLKGMLTPPESITRVRRVIQCKEGNYLPRKEVIKERFERQNNIKEFMIQL